jgi:hypothetical protein
VAEGDGLVAEVFELVGIGVRRRLGVCVLALCVGWFCIGSYADDEVFGVDEVVVEYGIEDGGAELACGAGEGELSHVCCITVCVVSLRLLVVLLLYC